MMQKSLSIFLILISLVSLAVSSSYASDNADYIIMAKLSLEDESPAMQNSVNQEVTLAQPVEYNTMKRESYVSLKKQYKQQDETYATDESFRSYIGNRNAPDALVNDISFKFSRNKSKTSGFDIGMPSSVSDVLTIGAAFLTNLTAHEFGHEIVAGHVGAKGSELNFFQKQGDSFFLGTSTVTSINKESKLPYHMGGEFFADMTFEHALKDYRKNPTTYNKSLLLFSGTDFVWYCFYAYYMTDGHSYYDPISIQQEIGLSKDTIFSIALAKTLVNSFRVYSGQDYVIPYFTVDNHSATLNLAMQF